MWALFIPNLMLTSILTRLVTPALTNASDVLTCHYSTAAQFATANLLRVTGAAASSPLDTHAFGTGTGTAIATGTFTTTQASEISIAAVVSSNGSFTVTAGTGYTRQNNGTSNV